MTKRKIPPVADQLEFALNQNWALLNGEDIKIPPHTLKTCVDILLAIDDNDRRIKSTFAKDSQNWSDERLKEEAAKHLAPELLPPQFKPSTR